MFLSHIIAPHFGNYSLLYGKRWLLYFRVRTRVIENQGGRTDEEMMNFINDYEYDNDDTYFYIRQFTFE